MIRTRRPTSPTWFPGPKRSTSVTSWPARRSQSAVQAPITPAPITAIRTTGIVAPRGVAAPIGAVWWGLVGPVVPLGGSVGTTGRLRMDTTGPEHALHRGGVRLRRGFVAGQESMTDLTIRRVPSRRAGRRLSAIGLAFAAAAMVGLSLPTAALGWTNYTFSSSAESQILTLINQARASAGLAAVSMESDLTSVARWRSKDMFDRNYFSHTIPSPPGGNVFDELHRRGICYTVAGEIIATNNYPDDQTVQVAVQRLDELVEPQGRDPRQRLQPRRRRGVQGQRWHLPEALLHGRLHAHLRRRHAGAHEAADRDAEANPQADPEADAQADRPRPTPRPTANATARPTPEVTPVITPSPSPEITPSPQLPTAGHDAVWLDWLPDEGFDTGVWDSWATGPDATDVAEPTGPPDGGQNPGPSAGPDASDGALQVLEPPSALGLLDTIVGDVVSSFLGN